MDLVFLGFALSFFGFGWKTIHLHCLFWVSLHKPNICMILGLFWLCRAAFTLYFWRLLSTLLAFIKAYTMYCSCLSTVCYMNFNLMQNPKLERNMRGPVWPRRPSLVVVAMAAVLIVSSRSTKTWYYSLLRLITSTTTCFYWRLYFQLPLLPLLAYAYHCCNYCWSYYHHNH